MLRVSRASRPPDFTAGISAGEAENCARKRNRAASASSGEFETEVGVGEESGMDVTLPPVGVVEDGDVPPLQALPNAEAKAAASILRGTPGCFSADGLSLEAAS